MDLREASRVGVWCALLSMLGCGGAQHGPPAAAASSATVTQDTLAQDLDAYISAMGKHWGSAYAFSGYVSVVRDGEVVLSRGYGKSDLQRGLVADADTRFRIGSITKQFTAVAVLQLVEQQKLRLDASIRSYLPQLPESFQSVTLHHLLSQTSGVYSYTDVPEVVARDDQHQTAEEVLASFIHRPLAFAPGTQFAYSNSNYFLLGLAIEKASGVSYESYLQSRVLGPAGMRRTSTIDAPDAPNTAVGYRLERERLVPAPRLDMSAPFASGALRSTSNDMLAWDRALSGDTLLSAASKRRLFTPNLDHYAYGFAIENHAGHEVQSHGGAINGFLSFFARVPSQKLHILVLGNNDSFEPDIGRAIIEMALTRKKLPAPEERVALGVPAELGARIAGSYQLTDEARATIEKVATPELASSIATLTITVEGDRTFAAAAQQLAELFVSPEGQLFTKRGNVLLNPEPSTGTAQALTMLDSGLTLRYVRTRE